MNPLGVSIGWILTSQGRLITGIFTSISAGTFVYIATMDVINEEFKVDRHQWLKFGFYLVGIGFICLIWLVEETLE